MFELKRSQIAGMNLSYRYFSFDYFLDSMERIGFQSVEIWGASPHFYVPDLTPSDIRAAAKKIKDHGLRIVCDGKSSGDEQFSLRQPARVVRCVRQIDTADPTAKSRRAAADRAARKHGQAQHLLQCGIVRCVL